MTWILIKQTFRLMCSVCSPKIRWLHATAVSKVHHWRIIRRTSSSDIPSQWFTSLQMIPPLPVWRPPAWFGKQFVHIILTRAIVRTQSYYKKAISLHNITPLFATHLKRILILWLLLNKLWMERKLVSIWSVFSWLHFRHGSCFGAALAAEKS